MLKKLFFIWLFLAYFYGNAQSNFEFQRAWSTYFGPVGGRSWSATFQGKQIFFDSQNNIYTKGLVTPITSYGAPYYQQFIMGGGQNFYLGNSYSNTNFTSKFNSLGNMLSYEYNQFHYGLSGSYTKELMFIDEQNNKYFQYQHNSNTPPIQISAGAWMTTNSQYLLAKYDANDNLVWSTYMPSLGRVAVDPSGNVYISGTTYDTQGIATPGVFQENFQNITVNGTTYPNGFLVKLNANGQREWGTYYPGYASIIHYHNNALYIGIGQEPSTNQISLPTQNAFQTTKSHFALLKMNANNGTREWGTYYGYPTGSSSIRKFEVNESGIYILGDETFINNSTTNSSNYYGTAGSHQPQLSGTSDLFLTKFSHSGERIWSTYVGGNGREIAQSSQQPLALSGNDIYVCGQIWGLSNNIATPGVYQNAPGQNATTSTNHFFAKFNSDGILNWTSYYGGTSQLSDEPINISINNGSLYLFGETISPVGYSTPGSWQPQYSDPFPNVTSGQKNMTFLAKFDIKKLNTQELTKNSEIKLYNNPNNGNFTISGELLKKGEYALLIFDLSGKLIHKESLSKSANGEHHFSLENKLSMGNYMVNITSTSGNLIRNFKMSVKK